MRYAKLCALLLFLFAVAATAPASYLNVNSYLECGGQNNCDLQNYIKGPGSPAAGYAMFQVITTSGSRWSLTFQTPDPYQWGFNMYGYYAYFGTGGTFQMTGPGDLPFLGEITRGSLYNNNGETYIATLNFTGQWSNNLYASGQLYLAVGDVGREAHLDVATEAPEPASLALLGSAVAGACAVRRRLQM